MGTVQNLRGKIRSVGATDVGKVREHNEDTIGVDLLPVLASTSSAIEFGTGLGFSIRLRSGSTIRK